MPEVEIDKKTRWECQRCGECCKGILYLQIRIYLWLKMVKLFAGFLIFLVIFV